MLEKYASKYTYQLLKVESVMVVFPIAALNQINVILVMDIVTQMINVWEL